jgi:hypothetical protein
MNLVGAGAKWRFEEKKHILLSSTIRRTQCLVLRMVIMWNESGGQDQNGDSKKTKSIPHTT